MSESKRTVCASVAEHLVAYVDRELAGADREAVEGHVATCLPCRREVESIKKVGRLVEALPRIEPSADLAARFQERLDGTPAITRSGARRSPGWAMAFAAAAAVALALGSVLNQGSVPTAPSPAVEVAEAPPEAVHGMPAARSVAPMREVAAARRDDRHTAMAEAPLEEPTPEDLPPDLLARPELFLRLPVVRRLEPLKHFEEVRLQADQEPIGRAPRQGKARSVWG